MPTEAPPDEEWVQFLDDRSESTRRIAIERVAALEPATRSRHLLRMLEAASHNAEAMGWGDEPIVTLLEGCAPESLAFELSNALEGRGPVGWRAPTSMPASALQELVARLATLRADLSWPKRLLAALPAPPGPPSPPRPTAARLREEEEQLERIAAVLRANRPSVFDPQDFLDLALRRASVQSVTGGGFAAVAHAASAANFGAVLQRAWCRGESAPITWQLEDHARAVVPDGPALDVWPWLLGWSAATIARDREALTELCAREVWVNAAASVPDAFWTGVLGALASWTMGAPEIDAHVAEARAGIPRAKSADPSMVRSIVSPLLNAIEARSSADGFERAARLALQGHHASYGPWDLRCLVSWTVTAAAVRARESGLAWRIHDPAVPDAWVEGR